MTEHRQTLKRVGWLLVVVGILDIGFMIYCLANQMSYSSSLNIFAVIAGLFLLRGHLGAVGVVTWFTAFMLSGFLLGSLILFPWIQPLDFSLLLIRKDPLGTLMSISLVLAALLGMFWVYSELRTPVVIEARAVAGHKRSAPVSAFVAGSLLVVGLTVALQLTLKGETAQQAKRLAAKQHGSEYRYFVSSLHWGGGRVSARLTAYNENASKEVEVDWQE